MESRDLLTPAQRSELMSRVRSRNTMPELAVRRIVHALGYRFRLHRRDLPGTPDIVFPRLRKVIQVHGCFWHRHGCRATTTPSTRREFWLKKFDANVARDRETVEQLVQLGWQTLVVWGCEVRQPDILEDRLRRFLRNN